jgi:hypothetical protein
MMSARAFTGPGVAQCAQPKGVKNRAVQIQEPTAGDWERTDALLYSI